jgi:hypothetical protein
MGFIDMLALNGDRDAKVTAIQSTSRSCVSARYNKITNKTCKNKDGVEAENKIRNAAIEWIRCGGIIIIIGFENDKTKCKRGRCIEVAYNMKTNGFSQVDVSEKYGIDGSRKVMGRGS